MHRQVGSLVTDEDGLALRGLIVRHPVMPGEIAGTREILNWIAQELGPDVYVNVMPQYYPAGKVGEKEHAEINRSITLQEFQQALDFANKAGLHHLDGRSVLRAVMR